MKKSIITLMFVLALAPNAFAGLKDYVAKADDSYAYEITETKQVGGNTVYVISLTSQTWQGLTWKHWLTVFTPAEIKHADKSLLVIAGGNNTDAGPRFDSSELQTLGMIASQTGTVCAAVSQIPNQPLFDGKEEDAIIAYTHEQFVNGEGEDWPLLFPMVKSAVRAMDTIQAVAKEKAGADVQQFMLTGASKRGWTTWLSAAADKRVAAIAPIVIDVLNMGVQMKHQHTTYGGYSEQVGDYTERDLQSQMDTEAGKALLAQTDPYSFREELTLPKLMVIGTNDPYWTIDAANLYFDDLKGEKNLYYQANTEHDVNLPGVATINAFYESMLGNAPFPDIAWEQEAEKQNEISATWTGEGKAVLWQATSPNRDFRGSKWTSSPLEGAGKASANIPQPESGYIAYYIEVQYPSKIGIPFGNCTKVTILPDTFAPEGTRTYEIKAAEAAAAK
jgi:PhoPQ-activated pathogenicity-related protein